jgi:hypothetical protein
MTRKMHAVSIGVLALSLLVAAGAMAEDRLPVFVRSAAATGGFTDPSKDRQDSMKDLVKKLKDSKLLRPVESEGEALVIVEVLDRETKRETNFWGRQNKSYLTVRLVAGEYSTEFEGESGSKGIFKGYGAAAGKVVDQVEVWAQANREQLSALRK